MHNYTLAEDFRSPFTKMPSTQIIRSPIAREISARLPIQAVAWTTVWVFVGSLLLLALSAFVLSKGDWSLAPLVMLLSTIAFYMAYIVVHEAAHGAVFRNRRLNYGIGALAMLIFHQGFAFNTFRFLHMRHHRFTNEPQMDPDLWAKSKSQTWLFLRLPLKWMFIDIAYGRYYARNRRHFSTWNRWLQTAHYLLFAALAISVLFSGFFWEAMIYWGIPVRLALAALALCLDYLPHAPYSHTQAESPMQATRVYENKGILDKLLFVLMLGQNYHLSHHLFPIAPFYWSKRIWLEIKPQLSGAQREPSAPDQPGALEQGC